MELTIEPLFGAAILEVVLYGLVMTWMGIQTGMARRKYGVPPPAAYENKPDSVFNRYQRAHMNAVESAPMFYVTLLVAALYQPLQAVIAGGEFRTSVVGLKMN